MAPALPTRWLAQRHSPATEATLVAGFYAMYEAARGLLVGTRQAALHRAHEIANLERKLHVFQEPRVQRLAEHLPGLVGAVDVAYLTLHLTVALAVLIWLYAFHPVAFPAVRTTLIAASALSLAGFVVFPTAPPRMAGLGLTDTVSHGAVDLNHGLISSLYNPYAAVPSMHAGYALIVGIAIVCCARAWLVRTAGALYPIFVLFVIVATGNHFFFDAAAGILVATAGGVVAWSLARAEPEVDVVPIRPCQATTSEWAKNSMRRAS